MKQDNGKKSKKWLLIVIAIIALLAAAAVAAVFIFGGNQGANQGETPADETPSSPVYWNLDRVQYTQDSETGLSTREKGEDGLYTFRFISDGKIIELKTADKQLVNYIDTMDAVGLVLDENGLIIDVLGVKDIAIENAKNFYVKRVDGNTIVVNSSIAMNGMDITLVLTEAASIVDVRPNSETLGQPVDLQVFDMVSVYSNKEEVVTSVFLHERPESSPLYLRVDRMYSSTTASTTREPDKNGIYTIPFAMGGKVLQLKCKDKNVVTGLDSGTDSKQVMGLTFDEEGYITGSITAATAARGRLLCQVYNVTAINGNNIEATRLMSGSEQGKVVSFNLTEETEIVMNENGCNHFIGEYVEDLKIYDRVVVWSDMDNNAIYIKIDRRKVEGDDIAMYYLKGKMYDSTNGVTSRPVDAKGYYVYELASKGKMVTVKTKDKEIATLMDGNSYQFFGLKVKGGIVQEYYDKDCLSGGYGIGGQRFVTDVMANIVRIASGSDFNSGGTYMLTDKTEIYNMTGYNGKLGSKTTLQVGDRVICSRDVENNITHIYVLDRPVTGGTKFYYNASRKYDSTNAVTTRTPDADGYYVYTMYCEGKQVEVKTKDKDIATTIDAQNAPIAAMKVNKDGIVTAAYPAIAGKLYASKVFNYNYIDEITKDKVVSAYYYSNGVKTAASKAYPLAKNCKIYNVSTNYTNYRGEKSSLKAGDRVQALLDLQSGELTHVWIMSRMIDSPLYINPRTSGETYKTPDADGYYSVELFVDGKMKTFRTKDLELITQVYGYSSETPFAMKTDGDIILRADASTASKQGANTKVSFQDVMKISGKNITTERKRPGQSNTGATVEFTYTSKTKIYDVSYYSENRWQAVKLQKGDRVSVYTDLDGNITYIFVWYPHLREKGYESKCSHCNKVVWWEPYTGSFIHTADNVHYYQPADYVRSGQGSVGRAPNSYPSDIRYTAVFDMNGKTLTSKGYRNFLVYNDLVIIDSVGGGVLEAAGYQGGSGGNFMVAGGTVEVNDGVTIRMAPEEYAPKASSGGNFIVSNYTVKDADGNPIKTNIGKITINDAVLEGWAGVSSGNFLMNADTVLTLNGGIVKGGNIELVNTAKLNWKGGKIESNLTLNGATLALSGKPEFSGILMNSNGGKIDISNLSTEASMQVLPSGVFTTESDNIDAYMSVFTSAAPDVASIVKEGNALAGGLIIPEITDNLTFVPGTEMAVCPLCQEMVTWTPITQEKYGETAFGTPAIGQHIYLAEDIVHTGNTSNFMNSPTRIDTNTPGAACFHLNGHNFTATHRNVIHGGYGIVNVIGSGVVTGNGSNGAVITTNTNLDIGNGIILHSGTFKKAAGNTTGVVQINSNGGMVTIGKDAVIETEEDELAVRLSGGYWIDGNLIIQGTVKGGYVLSDTAKAAAATDTELPNLIYFVLDGGDLQGGAKLAADTIIGLGGAAKVGGTGLNLTSGAKIMVSELTEGASVAVAANGVFTENIAVDTQKNFYAPAPKYLTIETVGQTLSTTRDPNAAPDLPKDPTTPAKPALLSVDNSNLVLNDANEALCPVCNKTVVWTAITDVTAPQELAGGMHYYLPADILYEQATLPYIQAKNSAVSCLHLNGHNITATSAMAIEVKGALNIIGNGIVSGNGQPFEASTHPRPDLMAATMQTNAEGAVLNVYGGTYVKSAANDSRTVDVVVSGQTSTKSGANHIVGVHGNGGTLNMFDGAIIDASATAKQAVRTFWGWFNMYGGEIKGNTATAVEPGNWNSSKSGQFLMQGGKISAGSGAAISVNGTATAPGRLYIYGGEVAGGVNYHRESVTIIGGNPKLNRLVVPSNMAGTYEGKFTLGRLTEGADITVYGSNVVFTFQSENVETYKNYFKGQSGKEVYVKDYALALRAAGTTPDPEPETPSNPADPAVPALPSLLDIDNSNLVLDGSNQAKCPVCDKVVTWVALSDASEAIALEGETHYYLANDLTYTGTANIFIRYEVYQSKVTCLHLNGHNITAPGRAIFDGGILNIMGNGIVTGGYVKESRGVTVDLNSSAAKLSIYGGTFKKAAGVSGPVIAMFTQKGTINIYDEAVIDGREEAGSSVQCLNGTINIYGGEIYGGTSGACALAGTYSSGSTQVYGTLNIFGGKLQASAGSGAAAYGSATLKPNLNIYGGEIRGGTSVTTNNNVVIGGTAVMNRLVVNEGAKFTLAEMKDGASITVQANGIFTNPSSNAATYVQYFHGQTGYKTPTVVENALFTEQGTDPETPGTEPEVPAFNNANLIFEAGTNKAMCPVCGEVKEWIAITQETNGETSLGNISGVDGRHYYLAEDITYTSTSAFITGPSGGKTLCFHLNGHNFTAAAARVFMGWPGTFNIMGNGIVTGGASGSASGMAGSTVAINTNGANGVMNIYGGIYAMSSTATNAAVIGIQNNGGAINIFEGATIVASPTAPAIYVGTSGLRASALTVKGADIEGLLQIKSPKTPATYATTVVLEDAKVSSVELNKDVSFTIKGDTTIEKLDVAEGAKFTVGELGANASINVLGNGVLSDANSAMATYFGKFTSTFGCELSMVENALVAKNLNAIDNKNLEFADNSNKAICPYCQVEVEWEALSDASAKIDLQANKHYYLANDLNFTTLADWGTGLMFDVYGSAKMSCLHLNGHNITTTAGRAIYPGGYLNIMGNGIVSGNFNHESQVRGATLDVNANSSSRLNLLGGTYTKAAENTKMPIMAIFTGGGNINMYAGATIDGTGRSTVGSAGCLLIDNDAGKAGNFTMYGGTIQNGTSTPANGTAGTSMEGGGNVYVMEDGIFTMYGGTVTGGKAETASGGNIFAMRKNATTGSAELNILGGTVSNGLAAAGGNINARYLEVVVKNASVFGGTTVAGGTIDPHGGNIGVMYGALTVEEGAKIYGGTAASQGGNVRCYLTNFTMNGGEIYGGTANNSARNDNVWIVGNATSPVVARLNGGTITATVDCTKAGSGMRIANNATVYFANNASVVDPENAAVAGVCLQGAAANLKLVDGWSGTANIQFASKYEAGATVTVAQVVKVAADLQETVGGTITGTLNQINEGTLAIVAQADGSLKIAG